MFSNEDYCYRAGQDYGRDNQMTLADAWESFLDGHEDYDADSLRRFRGHFEEGFMS